MRRRVGRAGFSVAEVDSTSEASAGTEDWRREERRTVGVSTIPAKGSFFLRNASVSFGKGYLWLGVANEVGLEAHNG